MEWVMGIKEQLNKKMVKGAERRGIPWELSYDSWDSLVQSDCHYCGIEPTNKFKYGKQVLGYSGLDRIDSGLGYTFGNVVPCCRFCNVLKSSLRPETWFDFLRCVITQHGGTTPTEWDDYYDLDRGKKAPNFWKMSKR